MRRLLPLLLLAGCAQPPPILDATGLTEAELVARRGVPSHSYTTEGRRFLAYTEAGAAAPAVTPSIGLGLGRFSGGWGSGTAIGTGFGLSLGSGYAQPCTTTYELREGRVIGATHQGPGC